MTAAPSWQFVLTDLVGVVLGELRGATNRTVALPHLRIPTASFSIPMWHPRAVDLLTQDTLLQCWRTDVLSTRKLLFNGPIGAVNEQTDNTTQTIAASATGPFARLGSRLIGTTKAGIKFPAVGVQDLGITAQNILDTVNGQEFTGISNGTWSASQSGATGIWYLKKASEAIAELTTGLTSFEFEIVPTVPTNVGGVGGWPQIGVMNIASIIGNVSRTDAVFKYGTGRANITGYERAISRDGLLTRGFISVNGWPDSTTQNVLSGTDSAARTLHGLYEDTVPDSGVLDDTLRQSIVDYHVQIRKAPRQILTFKPATNARPSPFTDFNIGDYVRARALVRGVLRFDVMCRVWGVTFNIDANGNEQNELELVMP